MGTPRRWGGGGIRLWLKVTAGTGGALACVKPTRDTGETEPTRDGPVGRIVLAPYVWKECGEGPSGYSITWGAYSSLMMRSLSFISFRLWKIMVFSVL